MEENPEAERKEGLALDYAISLEIRIGALVSFVPAQCLSSSTIMSHLNGPFGFCYETTIFPQLPLDCPEPKC